jgi:murein DD-endopeptidase MepM/ murein hydrolase activator NlpD
VLLKVAEGYLLFAHCSKALVKVGDHVKTGQHIAESGKDGNVTGPHLHMELQKGPGWVKGGGLNPASILAK